MAMDRFDLTRTGSDTTLKVSSKNTAQEADLLIDPDFRNDAVLSQDVNVNDDSSTDAIAAVKTALQDTNYADAIGDDLTIAADAAASAQGTGYALGFNQSVASGANAQSNALNANITGGDAENASSGGDGTSFNSGNTSQNGKMNDTDTSADITQGNSIADIDLLQNVQVENLADISQVVRANGGQASSDHGVYSTNSQALGASSVADDLDISGSTGATAAATGLASTVNQNLKSGSNQQGNDASLHITGTDINAVTAGGDGASLAASKNPRNADTNTDADFAQSNALADSESGVNAINSAAIVNSAGINQDVISRGGGAESSSGIEMKGQLGAIGSVGGDASIVGSAEAIGSASAVSLAVQQELSSGANTQGNKLSFEQVGGSINTVSAEGNGATNNAMAGSHLGGHFANTEVASTQVNALTDSDELSDPSITNDAAISQQSVARAGDATAEDGITQHAGNGELGSTKVDGDSAIAGTTSAIADGKAIVASANQSVNTGANQQGNTAEIATVGGNSTSASAGGDDATAGYNALTGGHQGVDVTHNLEAAQSNSLTDTDSLHSPSVLNNSTLMQTAISNGGSAASGSGISQADTVLSQANSYSDKSVGSDESISGRSTASADAVSQSYAFNQSLNTSANLQINKVASTQATAGQVSVSAGGDGATLAVSGVDGSPELASTAVLDTTGQTNTLNDTDEVSSTSVTNNSFAMQFTSAIGGTAGSGDGIAQGEFHEELGAATVGGDSLISGSTSASADAKASASAFNQTIVTGGNKQGNFHETSSVGGTAANVSAEGSSVTLTGVMTSDPNEAGSFAHSAFAEQSNTLTDADRISNTSVANDASFIQDTTARGGTANSGSGISQGENATSTGDKFSQREIDGDATISGVASASAGANAVISSFNQSLLTGGNVQGNSSASAIIGGNSADVSAGENDAQNSAQATPPPTIANSVDVMLSAQQSNTLNDRDTVTDARVELTGSVDLSASAVGGTATSGNGIESEASMVRLGAGHAGDDGMLTGASSARADANAATGNFNQSLSSGKGAQSNTSSYDLAGGGATALHTGEDDSGLNFATSTSGPATVDPLLVPSSSKATIEQTNSLQDQDTIEAASVVNNGSSITHSVSATGGIATSADGINADSMVGILSSGDDNGVVGKTLASANASAEASAFNQTIITGGNIQTNKQLSDVVGAHRNLVNVGEDSTGNGGNLFAGLAAGNIDASLTLDQTNGLNDQDTITDASLVNNEAFSQSVSANGGTATAGDGIADDGSSMFNGINGDVGDDYSITAESVASASSTAKATAFNQSLNTGGNTQVNLSKNEFTGENDTVLFSSEDDTLPDGISLSVTPTGQAGFIDADPQLNGADSTFDIEQANSLQDQDVLTNPSVVNNAEFSQEVNAQGGLAQTSYGMDDAEGIVDFSAGDDMSLVASTAATADALGVASAFNQTIVMGANVQANSVDISVVGGSAITNLTGEDDMG